MKQATRFYCKSLTDATDRANLWYIASPTARRMERDNTAHEIRIFGKRPAPIAVFQY